MRTIKQPTGRRLAVVGDPICLFVLAKPIFEQLEQEGYYLHRMPLAEYMLYLWQQDSKNSSKLLDACREEMRQLSEALGDWSPFADDFKYLTPGDQQMGRFVGGNGSYRLAKIRQESQKVDGILSAAAQYENTELILTMNEQLIGLPLYHMELGNRWENSDWERLRSFLYYL